MVKVIKTKGKEENYNEEKVFTSCYKAALNAYLSDEKAKEFCSHVKGKVNEWVSGKTEIKSSKIFEKIAEELEKHDIDASFLYRTHKDIS